MNTDEDDIQTAINNAGDIGCTFVTDITESEYRSMLTLIDTLMDLDPDPTTPDGIQLSELVRIVEQYESKHYPIRPIEHLISGGSAKSPTPTNPTPNHTCNDFA